MKGFLVVVLWLVRDLVCSVSVTRLKSFAQLQFLPVATYRLTGSLNIVLKNLVFGKCYFSFKIFNFLKGSMNCGVPLFLSFIFVFVS